MSLADHGEICLLCLSHPETSWSSVSECGCRFCLQCMEMYVTSCVRSGRVPVSCPDGNCLKSSSSQLTRQEVKALVTDDIFLLYLRLLLNREVACNADLMWCPRPGCDSVCSLVKETLNNNHNSSTSTVSTTNSTTETKRRKRHKLLPLIPARSERRTAVSVTCANCRFEFCSTCRSPWHRKSPCPTASASSVDPSNHQPEDPVLFLEQQGFVKRCPFCQIPIERDEGCAQMMCNNCRHVFCWFCLASLDDDFMLRHYDAGPCRSRLGHSRMSVVWHRAKVVSAFLGLGVLFLATSPLILLASPCLLSCLRRHSPLDASELAANHRDD